MTGVWRARLRDRWLLVLAVTLVLTVLVVSGQLAIGAALPAFLVLTAAIALLPARETQPVPGGLAGHGQAAEENALRLFAEALPDPCLVLDRRSVLMHGNAAAAQQFAGLRVGSDITLSIRSPALSNALKSVRGSGQGVTVELHQTVPTETWHDVTVAPLVAGDGDGPLVVTLRSLTDEKRLDILRKDFVANASHELRTPLTSLLGFIDTLMGPAAGDAAAREKFLGIMRGQAMRMSKLIDDLLSLSRIEMRQHVRPTGAVDLALLLREVREGFEAAARQAEVAIELDVPDEAVTIVGDRDELYEVFENLIDNALKYGAAGGRIDVALGPASRPGYELTVSVTDQGEGISAEHVPRLTERFYRVDAESSRRKKGTGLGLAIVKHIVTRHRGLLSIRSQPGQGTRVEVLLTR